MTNKKHSALADTAITLSGATVASKTRGPFHTTLVVKVRQQTVAYAAQLKEMLDDSLIAHACADARCLRDSYAPKSTAWTLANHVLVQTTQALMCDGPQRDGMLSNLPRISFELSLLLSQRSDV